MNNNNLLQIYFHIWLVTIIFSYVSNAAYYKYSSTRNEGEFITSITSITSHTWPVTHVTIPSAEYPSVIDISHRAIKE